MGYRVDGYSGVVACAALVLQALVGNAQGVVPPEVTPSDVEIGLELRHGGGGCYIRCVAYRIVINGTGQVDYDDLGGEPRLSHQQRTVSSEQVLTLLNEFLAASFFERPNGYSGLREARRVGDRIQIGQHGAADSPIWILSLRLASVRKEVRLVYQYPADLARLRDRVLELGGPDVWAKQ